MVNEYTLKIEQQIFPDFFFGGDAGIVTYAHKVETLQQRHVNFVQIQEVRLNQQRLLVDGHMPCVQRGYQKYTSLIMVEFRH